MRKSCWLFMLFVIAPILALADGYWLELKGSGLPGDTVSIRILYGGVNEQKSRYLKIGTDLDKMKDFAVYVTNEVGKIDVVTVKQYPDHWAGFYVPRSKGVYRILAINESLPVVERPDSLQNIKPVQYLCAAYRVESNHKIAGGGLFLNLIVNVKNDTASIQPFIGGKHVAIGTRLRVFYPDNHDETVIVGTHNIAVLPLHTKGIYLIRLDMLKQVPGVFEGKKYYAVRHRCDYTLETN